VYHIPTRATAVYNGGGMRLQGRIYTRDKYGVYGALEPNAHDLYTIGPVPYEDFYTSGTGWSLL
jgi:hypothetical protein